MSKLFLIQSITAHDPEFTEEPAGFSFSVLYFINIGINMSIAIGVVAVKYFVKAKKYI